MKTTYKIMKINWLIIVDSISTQIQIAIAWNTRKTQTRSYIYFSFLLFRFSSVVYKIHIEMERIKKENVKSPTERLKCKSEANEQGNIHINFSYHETP